MVRGFGEPHRRRTSLRGRAADPPQGSLIPATTIVVCNEGSSYRADGDAVEVEKRVKLIMGEKERLLRALADRQITLSSPVWQRDVYFAERGFRKRAHGPGSSIARIRYASSKASLNMKRLTSCAGVWEEIETQVDDGDIAERIMDAVGAERVVVVEKRRRSGRFGDIELQLDEVAELGTYLELSMQVEKEIGRARESIDQLLRDLAIPAERVELRGYPVILLEQQGVSFSVP